MTEPVTIAGLGKTIGARALPAPDRVVDLGRRPIDPDLSSIARARAKEVRAAFEEGVEMGAGAIPPPYPVNLLWSLSETLKRLAAGAEGYDVVGVLAVCSDVRAAGRSYWDVAGAWRGRAWIVSRDPGCEPVDLIVELSTLRRLIDLSPLGATHDGEGTDA